MTRSHILWASVLFATLLASPPARAEEEAEAEAAEADEVRRSHEERAKTLAERVPAVTRRVFAKSGRLEVAPAFGLSLNDPFFDHYLLSGALAFHVLESLWVGASGDFYLSSKNEPPVVGGGAGSPEYNRPAFGGRLELGWAPFYGKLSLLAETVLHFDTYVALGGGIISPKEGDKALTITAALGQHFFFNEWMGIRLELRDQSFEMARHAGGSEERQHLLSVSLGLCFYVPPSSARQAL